MVEQNEGAGAPNDYKSHSFLECPYDPMCEGCRASWDALMAENTPERLLVTLPEMRRQWAAGELALESLSVLRVLGLVRLPHALKGLHAFKRTLSGYEAVVELWNKLTAASWEESARREEAEDEAREVARMAAEKVRNDEAAAADMKYIEAELTKLADKARGAEAVISLESPPKCLHPKVVYEHDHATGNTRRRCTRCQEEDVVPAGLRYSTDGILTGVDITPIGQSVSPGIISISVCPPAGWQNVRQDDLVKLDFSLGAGWRRLHDEEQVRVGDEWWNAGAGEWRRVDIVPDPAPRAGDGFAPIRRRIEDPAQCPACDAHRERVARGEVSLSCPQHGPTEKLDCGPAPEPAPVDDDKGWDELCAFVRDPEIDTLLRCESEGGEVFVIDASRIRDLLTAKQERDDYTRADDEQMAAINRLGEDLSAERAKLTEAEAAIRSLTEKLGKSEERARKAEEKGRYLSQIHSVLYADDKHMHSSARLEASCSIDAIRALQAKDVQRTDRGLHAEASVAMIESMRLESVTGVSPAPAKTEPTIEPFFPRHMAEQRAEKVPGDRPKGNFLREGESIQKGDLFGVANETGGWRPTWKAGGVVAAHEVGLYIRPAAEPKKKPDLVMVFDEQDRARAVPAEPAHRRKDIAYAEVAEAMAEGEHGVFVSADKWEAAFLARDEFHANPNPTVPRATVVHVVGQDLPAETVPSEPTDATEPDVVRAVRAWCDLRGDEAPTVLGPIEQRMLDALPELLKLYESEHKRAERLAHGEAIESDYLTERDDRMLSALNQRDELMAKLEEVEKILDAVISDHAHLMGVVEKAEQAKKQIEQDNAWTLAIIEALPDVKPDREEWDPLPENELGIPERILALVARAEEAEAKLAEAIAKDQEKDS